MAAILGQVLDRADVDGDRLAAHGLSLGGSIVMGAAARDPRIRAVAASTPIIDWHRLLTESTPAVLRRFPRLLESATMRLGRFFDPSWVVFEEVLPVAGWAATLGEARLCRPSVHGPPVWVMREGRFQSSHHADLEPCWRRGSGGCRRTLDSATAT